MTLTKPENANYAAQIVRLPSETTVLAGLDRLVGVDVLGHQALTTKATYQPGTLAVVFTAETQLSERIAYSNNLFRDGTLNESGESTGYLEANRRVRALKLRGHSSNALILPLDTLAFTGYPLDELRAGDTFDVLNGVPICNRYVSPADIKAAKVAAASGKGKARVTREVFPEHLDTENFFRVGASIPEGVRGVITQKLHGTSARIMNAPVTRPKRFLERLINRLGVDTPGTDWAIVYGSRRVIKDPAREGSHYYDTDVWTHYLSQYADVIPKGVAVYGELVGWTPDGKAIQTGYTYDVPRGQARFHVYRVTVQSGDGTPYDLPWRGVEQFAADRGMVTVPVIFRNAGTEDVNALAEHNAFHGNLYAFRPAVLPLSDPHSPDEGICFRYENGYTPRILKAKSQAFLEHETKQLDAGAPDLESAA